MKGLFIPDVTVKMFKNASLESVEELMTEGEIYDIDYQEPCEDAISRKEVLSVLDKVRAEIDTARFVDKDTRLCENANASGLKAALEIIDKYRTESEV